MFQLFHNDINANTKESRETGGLSQGVSPGFPLLIGGLAAYLVKVTCCHR